MSAWNFLGNIRTSLGVSVRHIFIPQKSSGWTFHLHRRPNFVFRIAQSRTDNSEWNMRWQGTARALRTAVTWATCPWIWTITTSTSTTMKTPWVLCQWRRSFPWPWCTDSRCCSGWSATASSSSPSPGQCELLWVRFHLYLSSGWNETHA